ncbi:MAG: CidA/LrgA family protein [Cellvibrionaceae bacterium]
MAFLNGLSILLIFQLVGEAVSLFFSLSVPGPVIGMLLLFISLLVFYQIKNRKASNRKTPKEHEHSDNAHSPPLNQDLKNSATAILSHLSLLFIPAGVGLIVHINRLENQWFPIVTAILLGSIITMATTAWVMIFMNRLLKIDHKNNKGGV